MDVPTLYPALHEYAQTLIAEFDHIPADRKASLRQLSSYFTSCLENGTPLAANVICTHNSRRSHMGQLWLLAASRYYGVPGLSVYSGGTEATAFNPNAVAALQRAGFSIQTADTSNNPIYLASSSSADKPLHMFSKKFDNPDNPAHGFAAIMVCSDADEACPYVPGANARFALPFEDPKRYDGTDQEAAAYDKACRLIATQFFYTFSLIGR